MRGLAGLNPGVLTAAGSGEVSTPGPTGTVYNSPTTTGLVADLSDSTNGAWLWIVPPILYLFLTRITGIPFVEARKLEVSGDAYRSYVERTRSFFPWFPKSKNSHQ